MQIKIAVLLVVCALCALAPRSLSASGKENKREDKSKELTNQAIIKFNQDDCKGARADSSKAIEADPAYVNAYLVRAMAEHCKNDNTAAMNDIAKAIQINPGFAMSYATRGGIEDETNDRDNAMKDYDKAIEIDPKAGLALIGRARLQFQLGNLDQAMADFDRGLSLNGELTSRYGPELAPAYYRSAKEKIAKGDLDGGIAILSRAIYLSPNYIEAYSARADALKAKGDVMGANEDLSRVVALQ
jgi:tetratricopeptide (TPR) repeat protein